MLACIGAWLADGDVWERLDRECVVGWWFLVLMPALGFLTGRFLQHVWPEYSPFRLPLEDE
jgi:hypothetical protein